MTIRNKTDDVLFMSTDLFEHLNDAESYVFSHVVFFACQTSGKYKGLFKQTTRAICNKVGYSPNTVRKAIDSLIEKKFLIPVELEDEKKSLKYNYIDKVAHRLTIGADEFAAKYSNAMFRMLLETKQKKKGPSTEREMTFFKVNIGKLRRDNTQVLSVKDKNMSKHLHKTLILHGYLYNQTSWNNKRGRDKVSRGVGFLSAMMQWSQNTVRRVINTLQDLGAVGYSYETKTITFRFVSVINTIKSYSRKMRTSLSSNEVNEFVKVQENEPAKITNVPEKKKDPTPEEAVAFLNNWQKPV